MSAAFKKGDPVIVTYESPPRSYSGPATFMRALGTHHTGGDPSVVVLLPGSSAEAIFPARCVKPQHTPTQDAPMQRLLLRLGATAPSAQATAATLMADWFSIRFMPDTHSEETFIVGVVIASPGAPLQYKLLERYDRVRYAFGAAAADQLHFCLAMAKESLDLGSTDFGTPHLRVSPRQPAGANPPQSTLDDLFRAVVPLARPLDPGGNLTDAMKNEAVDIADDAMFELLLSHCISDAKGGQPPSRFRVVDDDSRPVDSIEQAQDAIQTAYDWLLRRGLVQLAGSGYDLWIERVPARNGVTS